MSKALTSTKEVEAMALAEAELLRVLENSLYPGAKHESIKLVIGYCRAAGLDPIQKPVHIVPIWDSKASTMRDVIMPGIGLYRTLAMRDGTFAGLSEPEFGPDVTETLGGVEITYPKWCKVIAKRMLSNGHIAEFPAIERWKENYAMKGGKEKSIAPNTMWAKRPYGQLAKCAEAQSLRKAFPEIGAEPTAEEMEGKEIDMGAAEFVEDSGNGQDKKQVREVPPDYPPEDFDRNLPKWREIIVSGRKSADDVISMISSKYALSADQCATIKNIKDEVEHENNT